MAQRDYETEPSTSGIFASFGPDFDRTFNEYSETSGRDSNWNSNPPGHRDEGRHGRRGRQGQGQSSSLEALEQSDPGKPPSIWRLFEGDLKSQDANVVQESGSKRLRVAKKLPARHEQKERITNHLLNHARDTQNPSHIFERHLKALKNQQLFDASVLTPDGLNLLGVAIVAKNTAAMRRIFGAGLWSALRQHKVPSNSQRDDLRNKDPKEIAVTVAKSKRVLEQLEKIDELENEMCELHRVCRNGDTSEVLAMIRSTPSTELAKRDREGNTALHYACMSGDAQSVRYLLQAGANIRAVNNDDQNMLHTAVIHTNYDVLQVLLKKKKIKVYDKDGYGKTPVMYTAENGHLVPLQMLKAYGAEIEREILGAAATNGCLPYFKKAMERENLDINYEDNRKKTILHHACTQGHLKVIKFILSKLSNVKETFLKSNQGGQNVFHVCCENLQDGNNVLKFLLEEAKRLNVTDRAVNHKDVYTGTSACVLVSGKDRGRPAFHYVETKRYLVAIFEKKVRSGLVDVSKYGKVVKSGWGSNPSRSVAEEVENILLERLQAAGTPERDACPIHVAVYKEKLQQVQTLIEYGADVNVQDCFGLTPMHLAAMRGNMRMIQLLEQAGADAMIKDREGRTALDTARENEQTNVVHYLGGKQHVGMFQEFVTTMEKKLDHFRPPQLEKLRTEGKDVHRHLVDVLRDVQIDINIMLMNMGYSPIMEESHG